MDDRTTPPGPLLAHAPTRRLLVAAGSTYSGEALLLVLLTLLALDAGGTGAAVVLIAQGLPRAALLPLGGTITDRFGAGPVAWWTAVARLVVLLALTGVAAAVGTPPLWVLLLGGVLLGVTDATAYPAALALAPAVVPPGRLAAANAAIGGVESVGDVVGPASAAALYGFAGPAVALGVVTVFALVGAVALGLLVRHAPAPEQATRPRLVEGLRYAWHDGELRQLLLALAAVSLLIVGPIMVGGAVLAEDRFGGREQLGYVLTGFGIGSLVGLLFAPAMSRRDPNVFLPYAGLVLGGGMIAVAVASTVWIAAGIVAVMGVAYTALSVALLTRLQHRTAEAMRGRVMALVALAMLAMDPLSYVLAGVLLPLGTTVTLAAPAGALVVLSLVAVLRRSGGRSGSPAGT